MIGKRALWSTGRGADITDARSLVTGLKHDLQAGIQDIFAQGRFSHEANNTYERISSQKLFSYFQHDQKGRDRCGVGFTRVNPISAKIIVKRLDGRMAFVPEGQHDSSQARSAWTHEVPGIMGKIARPSGTIEPISA